MLRCFINSTMALTRIPSMSVTKIINQPRLLSCIYISRPCISTGCLRLKESPDTLKGYEDASIKEPQHFKKTLTSQESKTASALVAAEDKNRDEYTLPHPIWSDKEVDSVEIHHRKPVSLSDKLAYRTVMFMRTTFDLASGYTIGKSLQTLDERSVLTRCIFLETVAGVPGFAAAMIRHLHSLRRLQRDHGWIHTLLEEAENERMHLMTFMALRNPGPIFRYSVILTQYLFTASFSLAYLINPNFCHRFVGYLEEQAVVTYTQILEELDSGRLPMWKNLPAPDIAIKYWELPEDAMMRDVILAIRADEAHHRLVNHTLGSLKLKDQNPFRPGA